MATLYSLDDNSFFTLAEMPEEFAFSRLKGSVEDGSVHHIDCYVADYEKVTPNHSDYVHGLGDDILNIVKNGSTDSDEIQEFYLDDISSEDIDSFSNAIHKLTISFLNECALQPNMFLVQKTESVKTILRVEY